MIQDTLEANDEDEVEEEAQEEVDKVLFELTDGFIYSHRPLRRSRKSWRRITNSGKRRSDGSKAKGSTISLMSRFYAINGSGWFNDIFLLDIFFKNNSLF
jgi:hypothetical protein